MTEPKKRGRPARVAVVAAEAPSVAPNGVLAVKVADAIHDGEGGFYPVGHKFNPVDDEAGEALKAKGLAE